MPKDVDVEYGIIENGVKTRSFVKSYHFENQEEKSGWYYFSDKPYLTKGALKIGFEIKTEDLNKMLEKNKTKIEVEIMANQYRSFMVYNLEDIVMILGPIRGDT